MTFLDVIAIFGIGVLSGVLSVLAGGGVTVVLPVRPSARGLNRPPTSPPQGDSSVRRG